MNVETEGAVTRSSRVEAKRSAILEGARISFLANGYSATSMDQIAAVARVSVKTIYNHFSNKADLFNGVIHYICVDDIFSSESQNEDNLLTRFEWFGEVGLVGLKSAGRQYLQHLLAPHQLALYRTVVGDAGRFPEIGHFYREYVAVGRSAILRKYLVRNAGILGVASDDLAAVAVAYEALLRAGIFEDSLIGVLTPTDHDIAGQVDEAIQSLKELFQLEGSPDATGC